MTVGTRQLLLLRHGKSSWTSDARTDFERPLKSRGRNDAARVGAWLQAASLCPDRVICSPATRARDTALIVCHALGMPATAIVWDAGVYEAPATALIASIGRHADDARRLLLVGHNPGLEQLLCQLAVDPPAPPAGMKLFPTAALAVIGLDIAWTRLTTGCARTVQVLRPAGLATAQPAAGGGR